MNFLFYSVALAHNSNGSYYGGGIYDEASVASVVGAGSAAGAYADSDALTGGLQGEGETVTSSTSTMSPTVSTESSNYSSEPQENPSSTEAYVTEGEDEEVPSSTYTMSTTVSTESSNYSSEPQENPSSTEAYVTEGEDEEGEQTSSDASTGASELDDGPVLSEETDNGPIDSSDSVEHEESSYVTIKKSKCRSKKSTTTTTTTTAAYSSEEDSGELSEKELSEKEESSEKYDHSDPTKNHDIAYQELREQLEGTEYLSILEDVDSELHEQDHDFVENHAEELLAIMDEEDSMHDTFITTEGEALVEATQDGAETEELTMDGEDSMLTTEDNVVHTEEAEAEATQGGDESSIIDWMLNRTYQKGEFVAHKEVVYESLQANNQGKIPEQSIDFWQEISEWNKETTYTKDSVVLHNNLYVYKAQRDSKGANPETSTGFWTRMTRMTRMTRYKTITTYKMEDGKWKKDSSSSSRSLRGYK